MRTFPAFMDQSRTTAFTEALLNRFGHSPTEDQEVLTKRLDAFLNTKHPNPVFIVNGYAGTGKTSLFAALIRVLEGSSIRTKLMAPTGRAAKVLSKYAGKMANTIHRGIYKVQFSGGKLQFERRKHKQQNTLFIVDEASMISDSQITNASTKDLLTDLLGYIFDQKGNKLILIGDEAQLPPVHQSNSPAMQLEVLKNKYDITVAKANLTQVVRQELDSGILDLATQLRMQLNSENVKSLNLSLNGQGDVIRIAGNELEECLNEAYSGDDISQTVVLCRSNKRANLFNQEIRGRIRFMEETIEAGDLMMVVKNNYFWLKEQQAGAFIANGDVVEVKYIKNRESRYGFEFADVGIELTDYPDYKELEVKVVLDAILAESPSLPNQELSQMYEQVALDYAHIKNGQKRYLAIKDDPYLNALQMKIFICNHSA